MISIDVPGFHALRLEHLVMDYNGTLAVDGRLLPGVAEVLKDLASRIHIHVITADTFGLVKQQLSGLPVAVTITPAENQAEAKLGFITELGGTSVVAIGNGRNDRKMLHAAALGIVVIQKEGSAAETLASADVVCLDILDALELLINHRRLVATLRC